MGRVLKKRDTIIVITVTSSKTRKKKESFKMAEYQLCKLIRLGRQEIHIALSNPNIDNLCSGLLCCHH